MRRLRSYIRYMAHRDHWCDRCMSMIMPGQPYEATIYVDENATAHRITTLKQHLHNPDCKFPDDPDDHELDKDMQKDQSVEITLNIAA